MRKGLLIIGMLFLVISPALAGTTVVDNISGTLGYSATIDHSGAFNGALGDIDPVTEYYLTPSKPDSFTYSANGDCDITIQMSTGGIKESGGSKLGVKFRTVVDMPTVPPDDITWDTWGTVIPEDPATPEAVGSNPHSPGEDQAQYCLYGFRVSYDNVPGNYTGTITTTIAQTP